MTRAKAIREARKFADENNITMVVVLEGPHADEFTPNRDKSHGYCPASAKDILYKWGTVTDTIEPRPHN